MVWRPLSILLCLASVHAALLPSRFENFHQFPLDDTDGTSCDRKSKTVLADASLPTVDLGYARHKAVQDHVYPRLHHFKSIRYAAPPTGNLRFKAPTPPLQAPSNEVEDGLGRKECLQATINWGENFPDDDYDDPDCCEKEKENGECEVPCKEKDPKPKPIWRKLLGGLVPQNLTDPKYYGEDCLHLDVWAPKEFWEKPKDEYDPKNVIVWIYGGAYIFGGKSLYLPGGLNARMRTLVEEDIVFVSMNYRMGALGFAAGKDIANEDLNAGLLDQRQALKWVKENIAKFGGDPESVAIVGLSAGGGSVMHHLTAYGGEGENLFNRAVSLSGGWQPVVNKTTAEKTFQDFMKTYNGVSSIDKLRQVSPEQMMKANYDQIYKSPPGTFTYQPVGWGDFAPKSPSKLLLEDKVRRDVDVMLSHTSDEGTKFAAVFEKKQTNVSQFLDYALPDLTAEERDFILESYTDGKTDAVNIGNIIADATFRCPVTYVSDARYGYAYRHRWNTFKSAGHGGDLLYLFYSLGVPVTSLRSARILQDYVLTFAAFGHPQTIVENPSPYDNPKPYTMFSADRKEQDLDSYKPFPFPKVTRNDDRLDYICRVWQQFECT